MSTTAPVPSAHAGAPHAADLALSPTERALARLAQSRAALRQQMLPPEPDPSTDTTPAAAARWVRRAQRWLGRHAAGAALLSVAGRWWRRQTWSPLVTPLLPMAGDLAHEADRAWRPWARQHPVALAAGAAVAGAALVALRPWRWLQRPGRRLPGAAGWLGPLLRDPVLQATVLTSLAPLLAKAASPRQPSAPRPQPRHDEPATQQATGQTPSWRPADPPAEMPSEMPSQMRH